MKKKSVKLEENLKNLPVFGENNEYRFKINSRTLSKNHKEIIKLDKNIYNTIKFNRSLKSVHRGSDIYSDMDRVDIWNEFNNLICILQDNVRSDLYSCDWYVSCITLPYIYDVVSVKGSPDYRGFDNTELNTLGKNLYGKFVGYSKNFLGMERISKKKYTCVVNWFIHYLIKIRSNCVMSVIYSRDEGFRSNYNVSNCEFSYSVLLRLVDYLREEGMVVSFSGNKLYASSVGSMMVINPKIFEFLGVDYTDYNTQNINKHSGKLLKITCEGGKEIDPSTLVDRSYYNHTYCDAVRVLGKYHEVIDSSDPKLNGYPLFDIRLHRTIKEEYGVSSRWFDDGSFQGKPKDVRKLLTLSDETTVSLDFKSLHPAILLFYKGVSLKDHNPYPKISGAKVYKVDVNKFKRYYGLCNYDPLRNLVKKLFLAMINADSINSAVGSIYEDLRKDRLKKGTYKEHTMRYVGLGDIDLHKVAKKILRHNKVIAEYLGTGIGNRLQFKDSNIIRYCLDKLSDEKIPCIPVHDSISCKVSDKGRVKEVMTEAFVHVVGKGSEFNCIIEEE